MYCIPSKLLVVALVALALPSEATAQVRRSFDPESYFKSLDRNGDERLDKNELNPKAAAYLKKIGMDLNDDRIKLRDISKQLERNKKASAGQASQAGQQNSNKALKVPAFGVEAEEYSVKGFGSGDSADTKIKFSESAIERARGVLRMYDRNQDNVLDKDEQKRPRWGRPSPRESDLNGDGLLSRDELQRRYHSQEQERNKRSGDNGKKREDSSKSSSSNSRSTTKSSSSSSSSRTLSRSSSRGSTVNYETYSKSLVSRYDKDDDDRLSKEEWKKIRRPPANADTNKDGYVTQKEYANALKTAAEDRTSSASSSKTTSRKVSANVKASTGSRSRSSSKSKPKSGSKGGAAGMSKLDKDNDNQVHMHEYSSKWDDKTIKEFYKLDENRDGIITATEWINNK